MWDTNHLDGNGRNHAEAEGDRLIEASRRTESRQTNLECDSNISKLERKLVAREVSQFDQGVRLVDLPKWKAGQDPKKQ